MDIEKKHRVFFAIKPDENTLEAILTLQKLNYVEKARFIHPDHIHLTLLFLGNIESKTLDCIKNSVYQIQQKKITLIFDLTGSFRKTGILWLGSESSNNKLNILYDELRKLAIACEIKTESRPYKAHITLARKFFGKRFINPEHPISFVASGFYLMESVPVPNGVKYETVEYYQFCD